jgi:hypothetical protein
MPVKNVILGLEDDSTLRLRCISPTDIEKLRLWKNTNKGTCFLNDDISPQQQEEWYYNYCKKDADFMFMVEQKIEGDWKEVGCMGFRKLQTEGCVDAYNIIRAAKYEPASFTLGDAFCIMLAYAGSLYGLMPLRSKVLKKNPAVEWYKKYHFFIAGTESTYYLMEIDKTALTKYNWKIKTIQ